VQAILINAMNNANFNIEMIMECTNAIYTGWPKKVSHYQIIKQIVLKTVNEIRFFGQIKV